jgi:hypothetical protein
MENTSERISGNAGAHWKMMLLAHMSVLYRIVDKQL